MAVHGDSGAMWTEARQLGQLFMMGFDGTEISQQVRILIENYHVGSILLTAKNLKSASQATQLVLDLQTIAQNAGHPVPLFIAIDQENGGVNSLYDETYIRQFPSAMGMAAAGSKKLAREVAHATAQELSSCGVNWILGPVFDVLTNARNQPLGVRSLGDDPQEVSSYGVECMKGYQEAGLATCGKHFPSYGNLEFFGPPTNVPIITDSLESLSQSALVPFRNAIAAGIDSMMVGGVAMSSSGVNVMHACLSEQIVQDLLRHEMHFDGVVVSECLEMEALSRNIGISGGTVMAFKAGCDIILTCRSLSVQEEAINGLRAGLDNGMIERARVQESVQRILKLKATYTSWEKAFAPSGIENLARLQPLHTRLSTTAYNKSITVVRDQKRYLPLSKTIQADEEVLLLTPLVKPLPASAAHRTVHDDLAGSAVENGFDSDPGVSLMSGEKVFQELGRSLARHRRGKVLHASYTANGVRPIHETLISRAKAVLVVTADAGRNMYQNAFAKHVSMLCKLFMSFNGQMAEKPCVVVAVSSPFDFVADTSIGTYLCTYDFTETALQALVKVLYGELIPTGTLPGSFARKAQAKHARQQWLVENFNEKLDSAPLNALLQHLSRESKALNTILKSVKSENFLLRHAGIDEAHFVVRNSTTKELSGFCATYYSKASGIGSIGAILVDPARRRLSIGHSLHDRAMRVLLTQQGIKKIYLGSKLPNIYLGLPKGDMVAYNSLRSWFAKLGWNVAMATPVHTLSIPDLNNWAAPEGLGKALTNADVKYDLVHGLDTHEVIMEHLKRSMRLDLLDLYQLAIEDKDGTGIIRAKRASDGALLGSLLLCRENSKITQFMPGGRSQTSTGCVSAPVISPATSDRHAMLQGLVLLGLRQLKKAGTRRVLFDFVRDDASTKSLYALGFQVSSTFDELTADPSQWVMPSG